MSNLRFRRYHWHTSKKAGTVYLDSSYELKAALILDNDDDILFYELHQEFLNESGRKRITDFLVTYKSGKKKLIEIKPARRICQFTEQIEDNKKYAFSNGYDFQIWSEKELGFASEKDATEWADKYLSITTNTDYTAIRKERGKIRSKKHYLKKIADDQVTLYCEFCKKEHTALKLTHDRNLARNGRYICEREGGHIAGSLPKLHLRKDNPHVADGKKECASCQTVKLFEAFSPDKSKRDGYCRMCKECRSAKMKAAYEAKKANKTAD